MTALLTVQGLSKTYRRGGAAYGTLRDLVASGRGTRREVRALDDVDLTVEGGETLAVIGENGAGKTTLLKIVARITPPDAGRVEVGGRLSALIEVGAGFHPELTGRENVMLHGSILGLARTTLRAAMGDIAAFAGLEDAMDTPVKHFSTGMYARLGFAVAVHAEPRVLLVDEVLSVGDEAFRARCYGRIDELTHGGCAILFVSHDLAAVERVAARALWLHAGTARETGPAADVVRAYRAYAATV